MATYVNDLRLKEIATGDESGTWGTSTNTNLELIAEGFSYATVDPFDTDADKTETMADGATDPIRSLYLKVTSTATLTATRTLTLAPNTVSKVWIIENATTGGQSISISQGSGSTVTIPNGDVKAIYTDGAGATAAVTDAFANLKVTDAAQTNITSVGTLSSLTVSGDLTVDTTTLYVDSANNRVGIGTTSPSVDLHVLGGNAAIYIQDSNNTTSQTGLVSTIQGYDSASTKVWGFGRKFGSTALQIDNDEGSSILFNQGGSEIARFDVSGQLGIAVTNVGAPLDIGTSNPKLRLTDSDGGYSEVRGNGGVITLVADAGNAVASSAITFEVDSSEKVRIDSSGNLGIGLTSPSYKLDVFESTAGSNAAFIKTNSGASQNDTAITNTHFAGGDSANVRNTVLRVQTIRSDTGDSRQAVLQVEDYGSNARGLKLDADRLIFAEHSGSNTDLSILAKSGYLYAYGGTAGAILADDASQSNRILISNSGNYVKFDTNGGERLRINGSGHVLVGITSYSGSSEGLKLQKDGLYIGKSTTAIQHCARFENPNGEVGNIKTIGTSTQFNTSSDARLKDVKGSARGLEVINALNPVAFNWTTDGKSDEGLLAQEVLEIVPNAVSGSEETQYYMDYSKLVTHLIAGMKEQQVLIEQLQAEVALLKGE